MKGILAILLAIATAVGGFLAARHFERQRCADETVALVAEHDAAITKLKSSAEGWAEAVAKRQGEAVINAFVSGISPSILAERRESLEISAVSLLRVPGVEGIHLFKLDGAVIYSSDAKLVTIGSAGEAGAWALAAPELVAREGARQGTLELAVPVVDSGRVLAVVWMEFGLAAVRDTGRPAEWQRGAAVVEAEAVATPAEAQAEPVAATLNPALARPADSVGRDPRHEKPADG